MNRVSGGELPFSAIELVRTPELLPRLGHLLSLALAALVAVLVFVPWQQNVAGSGRVVAFAPFDRAQTIAAPVAGRVRQAWVIEGSRVEAGDPLVEIVDNDPSILERLRAQRSALEAQLEAGRAKVGVYDEQVAALEGARTLAGEAAQSKVEVALAAARAAEHALDAALAKERQAELNFARQRELASEGLVSTLEFEVAEREYREAEARGSQARQDLEAAESETKARRAELGRVDTQARASVETARASRESAAVEVAEAIERLAELDTRIAQQTTQRIVAPRAGTVFRLYAAPGAELVRAGDPLVSLIPDTESRAVELWVDGNDVPLIEEGRPVRLQFEGWPGVQFAGWPSVAVGTFGGRVSLVDPGADASGRFRLLVTPDPGDEPWPDTRYLRQGVRANGFVLLDRVSLGYELWRQANGFPPTVAMASSDPRESATGDSR